MRRTLAACALAGAVALPLPAAAQAANASSRAAPGIANASSRAALVIANASSRAALVVDVDWLTRHLLDPDLVLLQVGTRETYDAGHIPGARFGDGTRLRLLDDKPGGLTLEMPPAAQLHDALESFGISDTSHVIVYASDGYWSPSARVLLTLDYAGLSKVSYLDGGLNGWTASGQPLSKEAPAAKTGRLSPLTLRPVIVDAAFVQAHERAAGFRIVDARNTEFYDGTKEGGQRGQTRRPGHIPGAVSAPYDSFASDDGRLKPDAEIAAVFEKAGVQKGDTVIGYCHIGQQATAMLLAARVLGHNVLLYDGSFEDWNARHLPLEVSVRK